MAPRNPNPNVACDPDTGGVYYILNLQNNRIYIGSASDLRLQMRRHYRHLETNKHINKSLQKDWNTYGADNFEFGVLVTIGRFGEHRPAVLPALEELEKTFIIKVYQSHTPEYGYNIAMPGNLRVPTIRGTTA